MTIRDATASQVVTPIGWIVEPLPRPEPSAGVAAYDMERSICLAMDQRKTDNYARYMRRMLTAEPDYLPIKLDIENVSRCNFACSMCAVSKWLKGKRAEDMSLDCFKRLIDEQYGLVEIKLNGLGEALMQGDEYFEMIRYARARHIWVRMTTNASLLHLRENYRKLIDAGVNEIDISIDGADAPTFEGIRIQGDFDRVTKNCRLLNDYCESLGIVRTKMWTLVQRANARDLGRHVRLAKELGFRNLVFSLQLHGWGDERLAERNRAEQVEFDGAYLWNFVELGQGLGVRVSFWDVSQKFEAKNRKNLCPWPFERAVVTSDSRTVPCCMIGDPTVYEIGKGLSFMQAWQGEEYRAFRQAHLDGEIPKVCKACYRNADG
jgi:pyrroloquinoline quinone biosynthesis protein E